MNPKLLLKTLLTIALFMMVVGCGGDTPEPAPAPTEAGVAQVPVEAATPTPVEVPTQAPAAGFTPTSKCIVPDVIGLDIAVAESSLAGPGLQPVKDFRHDESVAENAIISQDPPAGTTLEPCQGDVVVVVSLGAVRKPTETPRPTDIPASPTPIPTETPLPPTPTPYSGPIPFASPSDSNALNPIFGWQPGSSEASSYDLTLNESMLTLIAGPRTDQWGPTNTAPLVAYPISGNFEAQVKAIFSPVQDPQLAGLGVRSAQDQNTWLRITRTFDHATGQSVSIIGAQQGHGLRLNATPYSDDTVYLKIARRGSLFTLSYSTNDQNWIDLQKDYVFEMASDVELFITVFSVNPHGITAQFSDFIVEPRP